MADNDAGGLRTVLGLLGARGAAPAGEDTADLFANDAAPLPLPSKGASGPRGGRPLGARNKSTDEWARFLLSRYQSPLTVLAELYSRPLAELVDELQAMADKHAVVTARETGISISVARVDPLAVLKVQKEAAVALAEYLHKKQPKAIEVKEGQRGMVLLGDIPDAEVADPDDVAIPMLPVEQKQGVSAAPPATVGCETSDGQKKPRAANGLKPETG